MHVYYVHTRLANAPQFWHGEVVSGPRSVSATHTRYTGLVLAAALIGLVGAAGSFVFRAAIATAVHAFGTLAVFLGARGSARPLAAPLVLAVGGIALLLLERLFPGDALGYGFPRFLEMVNLEGGRVKRRWMIVKTLGAAVSLGAGASVGREGPIAQIGGSIGAFVARLLRRVMALMEWMAHLGKPLALGLVLLAALLAATGYFGVRMAWRSYLVWAWRKRRRARRQATL